MGSKMILKFNGFELWRKRNKKKKMKEVKEEGLKVNKNLELLKLMWKVYIATLELTILTTWVIDKLC